MATNEIQQTIAVWTDKSSMSADIMSKIKWFLKKATNKSSSKEEPRHKTKAFTLTKKDSLITVLVAVVVVIWAVVYGWIVMTKYSEINSKSWALKEMATYNITPNSSALTQYIEWQDINTVEGMIAINDNIQETLEWREQFKKQQKSYYEVLLQNIYLPSLNIWKNPYTQNFDMTILWQKYLDSDKFQDLYLIQYWSDFIKYVWNDADYNTVESINIWDKIEMEGADYFYTPISITFKSPNKRSFLLLVNKLSMTSNSNNIALVNEFFFYLLMNIKEKKEKEINALMKEYRPDFSTSSNRTWPSNLEDLDGDALSDYQDKVIGYNLYKRITYSWTGKNSTPLIDDAVIAETVRENALCDDNISRTECSYNFRDKYRDLPYLAYTIWLEQQSTWARTSWLFNFLKDLPSIITINDFWFEKFSNSSFLNNEQEQYEWTVSFNSYWRNITQAELNETSSALWKLCFWNNSTRVITPDVALSRVNDTIASLWWKDENINVSALWELQWIFEEITLQYEGLPNYDKMIKLFELWRMMNDANLCNV